MELQNAVSVLLRFQAPRMSIFSLIGAEARETIVPLTETALVKNADSYYYRKTMMDQISKHLYGKMTRQKRAAHQTGDVPLVFCNSFSVKP